MRVRQGVKEGKRKLNCLTTWGALCGNRILTVSLHEDTLTCYQFPSNIK
jgi:hypothetical protein